MANTKKFSKTRKNSFKNKNKNKTKNNKSKINYFLQKRKNGSRKIKINNKKKQQGGGVNNAVYTVVHKKNKKLPPVVPPKIKNPYVEREEESYRFNPLNNTQLLPIVFNNNNNTNNGELPPPPIQPRKPYERYTKPLPIPRKTLPIPIKPSERYTKPLPTPKSLSILIPEDISV